MGQIVNQPYHLWVAQHPCTLQSAPVCIKCLLRVARDVPIGVRKIGCSGERQDLPCTYLAHHELEGVFIIVVTIVTIIIMNLLSSS